MTISARCSFRATAGMVTRLRTDRAYDGGCMRPCAFGARGWPSVHRESHERSEPVPPPRLGEGRARSAGERAPPALAAARRGPTLAIASTVPHLSGGPMIVRTAVRAGGAACVALAACSAPPSPAPAPGPPPRAAESAAAPQPAPVAPPPAAVAPPAPRAPTDSLRPRLPTGASIDPVGTQVDVGPLPLAMLPAPEGDRVV